MITSSCLKIKRIPIKHISWSVKQKFCRLENTFFCHALTTKCVLMTNNFIASKGHIADDFIGGPLKRPICYLTKTNTCPPTTPIKPFKSQFYAPNHTIPFPKKGRNKKVISLCNLPDATEALPKLIASEYFFYTSRVNHIVYLYCWRHCTDSET